MDTKGMQRAHALLQVKRADIEARRITGIASTPTVDRQGDVLEPMGASFRLPLPLLWQHDHAQPVGTIHDARTTPAGVYITAQFAPEGTSDRIDDAWRMVRAGLVAGLSVGFIGREAEPLTGGGLRFTAWEVVEVSCVTVAANPEAAIVEVKRADAAQVKAADPDEFPSFPRSLNAADRSILAEGAGTRWADGVLAKSAKAGVKISVTERILLRAFGGLLVQHRWAVDRIEEMEAKHGRS